MPKAGAGLLNPGELKELTFEELKQYANRFFERQNRAFSRAKLAGYDPVELGLQRPKKPGIDVQTREDYLSNIYENYKRTGVTGAEINDRNGARTRRRKKPDMVEPRPLKSSLTREGLKQRKGMAKTIKKYTGETPTGERLNNAIKKENELKAKINSKYDVVRFLADKNSITENQVGRMIRDEKMPEMLLNQGFSQGTMETLTELFYDKAATPKKTAKKTAKKTPKKPAKKPTKRKGK